MPRIKITEIESNTFIKLKLEHLEAWQALGQFQKFDLKSYQILKSFFFSLSLLKNFGLVQKGKNLTWKRLTSQTRLYLV